jgi:hypothetical protein
MSAAPQASAPGNKASTVEKANEESKDQQKPSATLEEDDEFEDFPVEGELHECSLFSFRIVLVVLPSCCVAFMLT